jgi:hypothetical protein
LICKKNLVTTAQFFLLRRAVGELSSDAAASLKIATQIDVGNRSPSTMAAYYARDYRNALSPCSLQATVNAGGTANQNQQRRMLNRARVATSAGENAAPLDRRRLCVIR